jgi:hypothetical protein
MAERAERSVREAAIVYERVSDLELEVEARGRRDGARE